MTNLLRRSFRFLTTVAILAGLVAALVYKQDILDWWRLNGYQPPAAVVQLADHTTMTDPARRLFYVNRPELLDKQNFSSHCPVNEQSIVLGCYINNKGIFVFDVQEPRLAGVLEVTAAHEMLHAAYDRLTSAEKQKLNAQIDSFYKTLTNQRIKDTIELYRQKDPSVVTNELHSILGTEVRALSPELESYYAKYFVSRIKVVEYSEHYEKAFTQLRDQEDSLKKQLDQIKQDIDANEATLDALSKEIDSQRAALDRYLAANQVEAYNAAVPGFNAKIRQYNSLVGETKALVSKFNRLVEEINNLVTQEQKLNQAIDSRLDTQREK